MDLLDVRLAERLRENPFINPILADFRSEPAGPLKPPSIKIRKWWGSLNTAFSRLPSFWALWRVLVPWARHEITQLLIHHLVELAKKLDNLIIRTSVIRGYVVPGPLAQRPPNNWYVLLPK